MFCSASAPSRQQLWLATALIATIAYEMQVSGQSNAYGRQLKIGPLEGALDKASPTTNVGQSRAN